MLTLQERLHRAQNSAGDELWQVVRDSHPEVILQASLNRNLSEEMAAFIAKNRNAPSEALGLIAGDVRFRDSYKLKLLICRNPRTPQRVVFALLKFLRIFDLGEMTRDQTIPIAVRQKIEQLLAEKIPALPSGVKIALARRSSSAVVIQLLERGDRHVVSSCLESPAITESLLCSTIHKPTARPVVIRAISEHQKWSLRYNIRYALIINFHTPMAHVVRFIPEMKTNDLRELYVLESVPNSTKPYIFSELKDRGESVEISSCTRHEIGDEDLGD